jgi:hypothetical protein
MICYSIEWCGYRPSDWQDLTPESANSSTTVSVEGLSAFPGFSQGEQLVLAGSATATSDTGNPLILAERW